MLSQRQWAYSVFSALILGLLLVLGIAESSAQNRYQVKKTDANKSTVTVISGGISGTYIRFATDLANVLDNLETNDMRVLPIAGRGGGQNVMDILFVRGIDMGITQQDHLAFFKQRDPALFSNIENRVHYITKLYNSEYHLVARKDVKSFDDLRGKTVNFWKPFSATDIAGQTIFKMLGIDVKITHYDTQLALEKVKSGEIAATTLLAGSPIGGYSKITKDEDLHFVPLNEETVGKKRFQKLLEVYLPIKIKAKDYPLMMEPGSDVPTVASGAVLAVYNFSADHERYRKVAKFVDRFFSNYEKFLKHPRHKKWAEVNLAASLPGWTRFRAAEEWLQRNRSQQAKREVAQAGVETSGAEDKKVKAAFEAFLQEYNQASGGEKISMADREALYKQFLQWWTSARQ